MDAITIITSALILGIAAGIKPTAEQAIKDAYGAFKSYLSERYNVALNGLEDEPTSTAQQIAVQEILQKKGAIDDPKVVQMSEALLEAVRNDTGDFQNIQEMINSDRGVQKSVAEAKARQTLHNSPDGLQIITRK